LKNVLSIFVLTLVLVSCKKEPKVKTELVTSKFDLKTDIFHFKKKIKESDTIKMWFNHSVCTYKGYERIEITKKTDSIHIKAQYKGDTFGKESKWKTIFQKQISTSDTVWKIEEFLKKHRQRQKSEEKKYGTLQISHNENKIHFFTNGLLDLQKFIVDYNLTMKTLYPKDVEMYYSVEVLELNDHVEILEEETEMK